MIYNYMHYLQINFIKTGNPNGNHIKTNGKNMMQKKKTFIFDRETLLKRKFRERNNRFMERNY